MAVTITERPYKFSFHVNDIRYILNVSDPATAGAAVEIELYYLPVTAGEDPRIFFIEY